MKSLQENMVQFRKQLAKGAIQRAYRGLIEYMMSLKTHFVNKNPDFSVSGSLYSGYMDMTYFSVFPPSLKDRDLKIAVVFVYDTFRFEVWLSGKISKFLRNTGKSSPKATGSDLPLRPRGNGPIRFWSKFWSRIQTFETWRH